MEDLTGLTFTTTIPAPMSSSSSSSSSFTLNKPLKSAPPNQSHIPPSQPQRPSTLASPVPSRGFFSNYYSNITPNGTPKPAAAPNQVSSLTVLYRYRRF
jgi:hypothetical protein